MGTQNGAAYEDVKDTLVVAETKQGVEIHANLRRLTRYAAVFEIYSPTEILRTSEVLEDFKIVFKERTVYAGRAVVRNLVNAGSVVNCEVSLTDESWKDTELISDVSEGGKLSSRFNEFVHEWQKLYLVSAEYKVVVADLQTFLLDMRLWLEQLELKIQAAPAPDRPKLEAEIAHGLRGQVTASLSSMFERFEAVSDKIEPDLQPAHRTFGQRQLHPHLLCAPFIHRTFTKPLGYAGDYEMMNMIVRNGLEGTSLYAKLANAYLLDQVGPHAVRNRVGFLTARIIEETSRISRAGKIADIFCVACGPAWEAVNFLTDHPLAERARFQLLDFNEETLRYTSNKFDEVKRKHQLNTEVKLVKNSVQNLLRANSRAGSAEASYDLIYCSGLYDYLSDRVCKALNSYLYDNLRPGGLLVVGNFAPCTPVRNFIEHLLEWFLIYRDGRQLASLAPEQAPPDNCRVTAEPTGANIFLEIRKPK